MDRDRVEQRLTGFIREYAAYGDSLYWYPLTPLKKQIPVAAFDLERIYADGGLPALEAVFRRCGITTVCTFQMDQRALFEGDGIGELLNERCGAGYAFPRYVETFYFDGSETWLVYVSHEGTISFTGERIARIAAGEIPARYRTENGTEAKT